MKYFTILVPLCVPKVLPNPWCPSGVSVCVFRLNPLGAQCFGECHADLWIDWLPLTLCILQRAARMGYSAALLCDPVARITISPACNILHTHSSAGNDTTCILREWWKGTIYKFGLSYFCSSVVLILELLCNSDSFSVACLCARINVCKCLCVHANACTCMQIHAHRRSDGLAVHTRLCFHCPWHMPAHACTCLHIPAHARTCLHMPAHASLCSCRTLCWGCALSWVTWQRTTMRPDTPSSSSIPPWSTSTLSSESTSRGRANRYIWSTCIREWYIVAGQVHTICIMQWYHLRSWSREFANDIKLWILPSLLIKSLCPFSPFISPRSNLKI